MTLKKDLCHFRCGYRDNLTLGSFCNTFITFWCKSVFSYIQKIKTAALTAYIQIILLVNIAKSYDSDKHPTSIKLKSISDSIDRENKGNDTPE